MLDLRRLGSGCLLLLLAACQAIPERSVSIPPTVVPDAPAPDTSLADGTDDSDPKEHIRIGMAPVASAEPEDAPEAVEKPDDDIWQRLRDSFALPGCDYAPDAMRWARRYAASPRRFASTLEQLLPALDYTQRRMEEADLPGEFALLPIVESHFRPHPGKPGQPVGIWQMVGSTARSAGVRIDQWFDGRLNLADSTDGAVALLDRYGDHFNGDWRLVAFAYNAGEYRIKRALERHRPDEDFASLRGLGIAKTSYDYLTKLLALSCLVREPERFDLRLPSLIPERELAAVELDGVVSAPLARALSGLSEDDFARVNGGMLRGRTPPGQRLKLLVAADAATRADDVISQIPAQRRLDWQRRRLKSTETLDEIASRHGLLLETLLALNARESPDEIEPEARLWLPGRVAGSHVSVADAGDGVHVVRSGDSLWKIAQRYGLTVAELLRYNRLDSERLMPGQRLRLTSP